MISTTPGAVKSPWFNKLYPPIAQIPVLSDGQTLQLEELLKREPQVALISNAKMGEELKKAGVPAVNVSFITFDGLKKTVRTTAEVLGGDAPKIAEQYVRELEDNIAFVSERLAQVKESDKPVVLHIVAGNNLQKVDGGHSIIGDWVLKGGGRNALPEQGNMVEVSMEELVQANPDIIIIGSGNSQQAFDAVEKILRDPVWQSISAVKNKKVLVNPKGVYTWDRYSTEEALQVLWAAKTFHPDLFQDLDLVKRTQDFYQKYYHYDLSQADAELILQGRDPH